MRASELILTTAAVALFAVLSGCGAPLPGEMSGAYAGGGGGPVQQGTEYSQPPDLDAGPIPDAGPCETNAECLSGNLCVWDVDGGNHHCRPVGLAGDYGCRLDPHFEDCGYLNGLPLNCVDYADAGANGTGCCSTFSDHC